MDDVNFFQLLLSSNNEKPLTASLASRADCCSALISGLAGCVVSLGVKIAEVSLYDDEQFTGIDDEWD